jgi:OOP family OmpA-OmpF porin
MKKIFVLASLFCSLFFAMNAQTTASPVKGSLIGFGFNFTDFQTPAEIKATSLHDVFKNKDFSSFRRLDVGFSLLYWKGLTKNLDFSARYNGLFFDNSKSTANSSTNSGTSDYSNELEASLHVRPYSDNHFFSPFISAGLGGGNYNGKIAPYAPLGIGFQFNLQSITYIFLQANYRLSLSKSNLDNGLFYAFGITENISKPKELKVAPPPPPIPAVVVKDRDNDGVVDSLDSCPDVAGLAKFNGCPDTDGDGIVDKDDKCPTVAGLARYQGCPVPDRDKDGINDEEDKCPDVAGVARYQGCPVPDTDNDGVNDEDDKCPTVAGVKENNGCPVVKEEIVKKVAASAKSIFFASGSSKLLPSSFTSLNKVVTILKGDKDLKLYIEGHTDNSGKAEKNQRLSDLRAKAVLDYLIKKGGIDVSRLASEGFGDTQPIASNNIAKGKALNRRVLLKLKYY